jgi:hypothetical protein
MDRALYRNFLDGLEEVESKTDLFRYAQETVETETLLPGPLGTLMDVIEKPFRGQRKNVMQEVFEEAKQEVKASN